MVSLNPPRTQSDAKISLAFIIKLSRLDCERFAPSESLTKLGISNRAVFSTFKSGESFVRIEKMEAGREFECEDRYIRDGRCPKL